MTTLIIPPHEHSVLRVFDVIVPAAEVDAMEAEVPPGIDPATHSPGPSLIRETAMRLLDVPVLLTKWTTLFKVEDLGALPLADFLIQSENIPADRINPDADRLNNLKGYVLTVWSEAFEGQAATLDLGGRLRLIGTYPLEADAVVFEPLPSGSAKGVIAAPADRARANRRMMGLVSTITLLMMLALVGLMVWVAG